MSKLERCTQGHFYDAEKYHTCPYCQMESTGPTELVYSPSKKAEGTPMTRTTPPSGAKESAARYPATQYKSPPVVGWLVSIEGACKGKDFRLVSGKNYIGRRRDMDIRLKDDKEVSSVKHAIVIFDPVSMKTLCQTGESRSLCYLNGKVITDTVELAQGDILTVGRTELIFVPFCSDIHRWNVQS